MFKRRRPIVRMKFITAKFASKCAETGKVVNEGDECLYDPNQRKVYCSGSKQAASHRSQAEAEAWGMADANW